MHRFSAAAAGIALLAAGSTSFAQAIYPIDRAEILAGTTFDFKVEFPGLADPAKVSMSVNGEDHAKAFGKAATFIAREDGKDQSALILREVSLTQPGDYKVRVTDGVVSREITWNVYANGQRKAKTVILFIGDGMSPAHRTAARLLAKGIAEGKARGKLAIDDMPHMALVATAGSDSIITDSANSASAYATGHKSAVNAMGVYADRTRDPLDDPKVETITSLVTRRLGMAVGVITNTEIEDATPAAMVAHVRRRSEYDRIVEQYFAAKPDVLMGGGRANFLPKGADGSKRRDEANFLTRFREAGYSIALTGPEMGERVRVNERAGFPNHGTADAQAYLSRIDVSRRLALFSASLPDHYDTYRPKLDSPNDPTVAGKEPGTYVANDRYKNIPGAV